MSQSIRDHRARHLQVKSDLSLMIENSPESVDAILYTAVHQTEVLTDEPDTVGSIEDEELSLSYEDPAPVKIKFLPPGSPMIQKMNYDGGDLVDLSEDDILLLISGPGVANESVIEYQEYTGEEEKKTITLIVKHSQAIGRSPVIGQIYFLIPFTSPEGLVYG